MFKLQRFLSIIILISLAIAAIALGLFYYNLTMKTLIDHGQEENQRIAETLVSDLRRQIVPLLTSTHPPNAASEINARSLSIVSDQITQKLKGLNTVKVKIYDQQGMTLFSTTENEIGQSQKNNPGFQLAVNGQVISHFVHKNKFNAFDGVMSDKDLLQTYLPITLHTKTSESTIGVFEVYSDFTQLLEDVNGALVTATAAIAVIFLLLYSILFLSMRHANRTVDKQNFALKNSLDEIESIKKGLERTVEARTNALRISNKVLEEEIEQRAAIENSIRLQEMKLHAIMDNTFTAIVTIDSGGLIRSFNSTAESLFILSSEEAINRPLSSLMPEDAQSRFIEYLEFIKQSDTQESKKPVLELAAYQRGGLRIPIELAITRMAETGSVDSYICVISDISLRKKAEEDLEDTRRRYFHQEKMAAIGTLSAGIVHEIGNPIAAISALIEATSAIRDDDQGLPDEAASNLQLVQEQVDRLIRITKDVSEFSTPQSSEPELLDLNNLIGRTVRLMRHDRRLQQTEIKLNLDPQLPAINLAGNQIIQILMNLLANAADALTDLDNRSPQINVSSRTQGSAVIMEVEDNGCGMDQNTIAHASEAFFTTKSMGEGTGLGLSLCHSLIENHRGQMIIDSTPDQGTRITISLPIESDKDGAAV